MTHVFLSHNRRMQYQKVIIYDSYLNIVIIYDLSFVFSHKLWLCPIMIHKLYLGYLPIMTAVQHNMIFMTLYFADYDFAQSWFLNYHLCFSSLWELFNTTWFLLLFEFADYDFAQSVFINYNLSSCRLWLLLNTTWFLSLPKKSEVLYYVPWHHQLWGAQ